MIGSSDSEVPEDRSLDSLAEFYIDKRDIPRLRIGPALEKFKSFLDKNEYEVEDVGVDEVIEFADYLRSPDGVDSPNTREIYYSHLRTYVDWYCDKNVFDRNPFATAQKDYINFAKKETVKRQLDIEALRNAIKQIKSPRLLTFITVLLKLGLRLGEAHNLDHRDIHLDHPISEYMDDPRPAIASKPDTIHIDSSISEGEVHNGVERTHSNKPYSTRTIPIDKELKETLVWYISMSPHSRSAANPLFRTSGSSFGDRVSFSHLGNMFNGWADENEWRDDDRELNIHPHWCRHWFTSMLRKNIDSDEVKIGTAEGYIEALRGDSADSTIDIYTHDWTDENWVRKVYESNIPSLFDGLNQDHYEATEPTEFLE